MASEPVASPRHVVVVGNGISGVAAAYRIMQASGGSVRVTVVGAFPRPGGKLRTSPLPVPGPLGAFPLDEGAEAFRLTDETTTLLRTLNLDSRVMEPVRSRPLVWVDGQLHALPAATLMGIPTDVPAIASGTLLDPATCARIADEGASDASIADLPMPGLWGAPPKQVIHGLLAPGADVAVGELVAARLGLPVVERLVGPLLAGVYAGDPMALSLRATLPALAARLESESSLVRAARAVLTAGRGEGTGLAATSPAFVTLRGGMEQFARAMLAASGAAHLPGVPVRAIRRRDGSLWDVVIGTAAELGHADRLEADAVVLAVPAATAARLLDPYAPNAAETLKAVRTASVGVVTLAYGAIELPDASGVLVAGGASSGLATKAITFTTRKWPYGERDGLPPETAVLRASVGRAGEVAVLQHGDDTIAAQVATEVARITGADVAPMAWRVTRWGGALPQYDVGHVERMAAVQAEVAGIGGIAVGGATYGGVGIPACIESGFAAADAVFGELGT